MARKRIPLLDNTAGEKSSSHFHLGMLSLNFKSVASSANIGRKNKEIIRFNGGQTVENSEAVNQITP
ncbi:MAG: hypothetical protein GY786_02875 [Proteobacteria bacterium]|nr:hypothetical protein [Pseudomonadota bacterium]